MMDPLSSWLLVLFILGAASLAIWAGYEYYCEWLEDERQRKRIRHFARSEKDKETRFWQ